MNQFSISQLAQFSGIKAHTIRIWEQRYNALQPHRSEGNTRYYDGLQLRRLLNIVSLLKFNYKVSQLCKMTDEELSELQRQYHLRAIDDNDFEYFINQLIAAGVNYDEQNFNKFFSHCLLRFGLKKTYVEVLYPVLERIGVMWSIDQMPPTQEHYITNLLQQKLYTAIDSLAPEKDNEEVWLLFLPENEFHEIGLLFANYLIRSRGKKVIYLGSNVPLPLLNTAVKETMVTRILTFLVHNDLPENVSSYLKELKSGAAGKEVFVASAPFKDPIEVDGINWVYSVEDLDMAIGIEAEKV